MLLYAISRFIIEFYRGDERGTVGMFSTSQFISIVLAPLAIVMLVYLSRAEDARAEARAGRPRERPARSQTITVPRRRATMSGSIDFSPRLLALSRSQIQRLIKDGAVLVAGRAAKANQAVKAGQEIAIDVPEPIEAAPAPEALPLPIVYQDQDLIVVDKPAGMVVHPAAGHASGTLVNALLHHVDDLSGIGGEKRPGIVHRLDRGTSGLMVVAKHDRRARRARAAVRRARSREGVPRARLGRGDGRPPDRRADRPRSVEPQEDGVGVGARAPHPRGGDAHRPRRALRPRADAGAGRDSHRPHASDPRAPQRDRPSRSSATRCTAASTGACRATCARSRISIARFCTRRASCSRIPTTAGGWSS